MKPKTLVRIVLIGLLMLGVVCGVLVALGTRYGHLSFTPPLAHPAAFTHAQLANFPAPLHAQGRQLVDAAGQPVILQGLMPQDPAILAARGRFQRDFFARMGSTQANVLRIPVHPEEWARDPDYLWRYLDPAATWAGELGLYMVIDWHYIGNVADGSGPKMPDLERAPKDLTLAFWQQTAAYFRDTPHVIFEIFNEPQNISGDEWRRQANEIIAVIRQQGAQQLVIVGGVEYGKDLSWVTAQPVEDDNTAYASHVYPAHASTGWPQWFGNAAAQHPVIITEWGFMESSADPSTDYLVGSRSGYGEPFLAYLAEQQVGWIACWYDDEWLPPMLAAGGKDYTPYGAFVIEALGKR